ncbi:MAG: LysR family transcriptional regulator [Alphaproteobacteria bacterium]|nr:LysR family transcriptional regulator [Alphaproteobacteria bacterium]
MSLRQLETLVAIADAGSFHAAAGRLSITQSAVSMQMKALEEDLQTPLFDRSRRPPTLRENARPLIEQARHILRLYESFQIDARADGAVAGILRIGVIPTASTGILPDALAILRERTPRLQVRIENELSTELVRRVERGMLDAAILTEPSRLNAGLGSRVILEERLLVVAPIDSPGESDVDLLTALPFVRFNRRAGVGRVIDGALRSRGIEVRERMELDSIESILMMVSRGLGVAIAPERSISAEQRGSLKCIPFGDPPVRRRVGLVERAGQDRSTLTDALYDALVEVARREV